MTERGEAETKTTIMKFGMFPILRSDDYVEARQPRHGFAKDRFDFLFARQVTFPPDLDASEVFADIVDECSYSWEREQRSIM